MRTNVSLVKIFFVWSKFEQLMIKYVLFVAYYKRVTKRTIVIHFYEYGIQANSEAYE